MLCGICMWTLVWLLSGVRLHRGAASVQTRAPAAETAAYAPPAPPPSPPSEGLPPQDAAGVPQRDVSSTSTSENVVESRDQRQAHSGVQSVPGQPPNPAASPAHNQTVVDELLMRARDRGGPHLKQFEKFAQEGRVEELMHDPYPPDAAGTQKRKRSLVLKASAEGEAVSAQEGGAWDWVASAFGESKSKGNSEGRREHVKAKAKVPLLQKSPEKPHLKCDFEDDLDYVGKDVGTVEGLSDQACCELCTRKGEGCDVAVMSSEYDAPPRACWLKTKVLKSVKKDGVRACWPPNNKKAWAAEATPSKMPDVKEDEEAEKNV